MFVLILRCREGDGAEDVRDTKLWGGVEYRRFGSGVLPARDPWWLQNKLAMYIMMHVNMMDKSQELNSCNFSHEYNFRTWRNWLLQNVKLIGWHHGLIDWLIGKNVVEIVYLKSAIFYAAQQCCTYFLVHFIKVI